MGDADACSYLVHGSVSAVLLNSSAVCLNAPMNGFENINGGML